MDTEKNIRLCIIGFTPRGANGVKFFIEKHATKSHNIKIVEQPDEHALLLVDGDTIDGQTFLTDYRTEQQKVLVARFKKDENSPHRNLMKPIIPDELMAELFNLNRQELPVKTCKTNKSITKDLNHHKLSVALRGQSSKTVNSQLRQKKIPTETVNFYTPENYLQGVVMRCLKKATHEQPYVQAHLPFGDVVIDAADRKVYCLIGHKKIRSYENLRLTQSVMIRYIDDIKVVQELVDESQIHSLDEMLWDLSVSASIGRLPQGADIDKPMRLKYWPNLTRVRNFEFATQIAALWSQNTLSIRQVIEHLGIAHNFVYAFYASAQALNLMIKEHGKVTQLKTKEESVEQVSIMARLLTHLRKAS
jgi:hypothetical protein